MAWVTKEWLPRLAEFIGRRKFTNVVTGEVFYADIERAEGEVSRVGDAFSPANMNDLEQRIADEFTAVNQSLTLDWDNAIDIASYNGVQYTPIKRGVLDISLYSTVFNNFNLAIYKTSGQIVSMDSFQANSWFAKQVEIGKNSFKYTVTYTPGGQSGNEAIRFLFVPYK